MGIVIFLATLVLSVGALRINKKKKTYRLGEDDGKIRVAVVGSSLTEGWGGCDDKTLWMVKTCPPFGMPCDCAWDMHSYPTQMQKELGDKYDVENMAASCTTYMGKESGSDGGYKYTQAYSSLTSQTWDVIIFSLGSNDFRWFLTKASENCEDLTCPLAKDMTEFIQTVAAKNPGAHLMVTTEFPCSDPAQSRTLYMIDCDALQRNGHRIFTGVAAKVGAEVLPVDKWVGGWPPKKELFAKDGFHMTRETYGMLAKKIAAQIVNVKLPKDRKPKKKLSTAQAARLPGIVNMCVGV